MLIVSWISFKTTACLKKIVINKIIQLCFTSAIYWPFYQILLFHFNTIYMRRKMNGHTLLKVSFKLRYSMFRKVTYSIRKPKLCSYKGIHKKINQSNFEHFPSKVIFDFLIYKVHIKPNKVSQLSRIKISMQNKTCLFMWSSFFMTINC